MGINLSSPNKWHILVALTAYALIAVATGPSLAGSQAGFVERGIDRPGGDYSVLTSGVESPRYCASACAADNQCRAWTYVNAGAEGPSATCHLKLTVPHAQSTPCCTSGVAVGSSEPGRIRGY
jgi:PAN domain-containing protein